MWKLPRSCQKIVSFFSTDDLFWTRWEFKQKYNFFCKLKCSHFQIVFSYYIEKVKRKKKEIQNTGRCWGSRARAVVRFDWSMHSVLGSTAGGSISGGLWELVGLVAQQKGAGFCQSILEGHTFSRPFLSLCLSVSCLLLHMKDHGAQWSRLTLWKLWVQIKPWVPNHGDTKMPCALTQQTVQWAVQQEGWRHDWPFSCWSQLFSR